MRGLKLTTILVALVLLVFVTAATATWLLWDENGVSVCTTPGEISSGSVIADGAGGIIVVWQKDIASSMWDSDADVYAQRIGATGNVLWKVDGLDICTADGYQSEPSIVTDGAGGAIITWLDQRDRNEIYAQHIDASGDSLWTLNGICVSDSGAAWNHAAASDGSGGAIAVWEWQDPDTYVRYLRGQRVDGSGNKLWTPGGVDLSSYPVDWGLEMIPSGSGEYILVWLFQIGSYSYDEFVVVQKVNSSGTPLWGPDGVFITGGSEYIDSPTIVSDGAGGVIVFWEDSAGDYEDIYAQRVSAAGELLWYPTGVPVCTAFGEQEYPQAVTDGAGGAIVAWTDGRTWGDYDVYAQRLDSSGNPVWAANGVNLCTDATEQGESDLSLVSDGAGGAIVFFENIMPFTRKDIYAQRIDATGSVQWFPEGLPVRTADGPQGDPASVSDGSGGAIVVWKDKSNGLDDHLYAQHVNNGPSAAVPEEPAIRGGMLAQNVPNPFISSTSISFTAERAGNVRLEVFDATGRLVRSLYDGPAPSQVHTEQWDGTDQYGRAVPSGMYFCRANGDGWNEVKKMTLAR